MGAWTTTGKSRLFEIGTTAAPTPTLYLALYSNSANPAGTPTELTLSGYARVTCVLVLNSTDHASNAYDLVFGPLGAGSYLGVAILESPLGGTPWFWDDESGPITIPAASNVTFLAGTLQLVRV